MAWTERLPSGRYRGRYRDRDGNEYSLPDTYTSKPEAEREAWRKEDEVRKRPAYKRDAGKMFWRDWVEVWWPKRKVEAATLGRDAPRRDKHLLPKWGGVPLERIERDEVQAWVNDLAATDMSASTVAKCYSLLSASLKAAVIAGRIGANPCVSVSLPVIPPSDEHYLEREEYALLRAAIPEGSARTMADLLVGTGMRWGEAAAIHRSRINLGQKRIDVMDAVDSETGAIKAYPKGKKKRTLPLTTELAETLKQWMESTPAVCESTHAKGSACRGGLLIAEQGRPLDYSHYEKYVWRPAVKKSGVGHTCIHDLRHTYASWLIQQGVTLDQIGILLGHASLQTTQRYAHLVDSQWDAVRSALGEPDAAPDLPHVDHEEPSAKIIQVDFSRRSAG